MRVNVAKALKNVGESYPFSVCEQMEPVRFGEDALPFATELSAQGSFGYDGELVLARGELNTALKLICSRCAQEFTREFTIAFDERFSKTGGEEYFSYDGVEIDLDEMLLANLILNLPIAPVCREDCKGLCNHCGANLNETYCSCHDRNK